VTKVQRCVRSGSVLMKEAAGFINRGWQMRSHPQCTVVSFSAINRPVTGVFRAVISGSSSSAEPESQFVTCDSRGLTS